MPMTSELVTRAKDGSGTPFLFCHGDTSTRGFYALRLADLLTCKQPVYLLHPHVDPHPKLTIEEMARSHVSQLVAAQPTGAFRVGGYCNGGLLAWEIACQLDRLGREVEAIVLVDTISLNARPVFRAIARLLGFVAAIVPKRMGEKLKVDGMLTIWRVFMRAGLLRKGKWRQYLSEPTLYSRAMSNYVPSKMKTRVFCVVCEESRRKKIFSTTPWVNIAHELRSNIVTGTHYGCITKHVGEVARSFDEFFHSIDDAAQENASIR